MTGAGKYTAVKYIVLVMTVGFVVWLMLFVGASRRPFEEVSAAVEQAIDEETLVKQDGSALKRSIGLNSADYEGVSYYTSVSGISAEELLLVRVKSTSQISGVSAALDEYVEKRIGYFGADAPEQVKILEDAGQIVRGRYIFFYISSEAERYQQAFLDSL